MTGFTASLLRVFGIKNPLSFACSDRRKCQKYRSIQSEVARFPGCGSSPAEVPRCIRSKSEMHKEQKKTQKLKFESTNFYKIKNVIVFPSSKGLRGLPCLLSLLL